MKGERTMAIEKEKLLWIYKTMVRHREFEDTVQREFAAGNIPGFVHLSQGEEAVAAGAIAVLKPDDIIFSTHRGHGQTLAKGGNTNMMMAELFGKKTGIMKGKGGSMHFAVADIGSFSSMGLVGTNLTIAPGFALASKLRGTNQVTLCFFGDGCINTERFHTGVNLASIWKLPVVFICVNNHWAESTSIDYATNLDKLSDRAAGYGIPGITVDGNDAMAVYEVVDEAVARARKGLGPTLVEARTCRQRGHFEGDTQAYRRKGEVEECKKRDPIPRFRKKLIQMGMLTEEEAGSIHREAVQEMNEAVKFAQESPFPGPEELLSDVYA